MKPDSSTWELLRNGFRLLRRRLRRSRAHAPSAHALGNPRGNPRYYARARDSTSSYDNPRRTKRTQRHSSKSLCFAVLGVRQGTSLVPRLSIPSSFHTHPHPHTHIQARTSVCSPFNGVQRIQLHRCVATSTSTAPRTSPSLSHHTPPKRPTSQALRTNHDSMDH